MILFNNSYVSIDRGKIMSFVELPKPINHLDQLDLKKAKELIESL
jgi:hypothetical protein